MNSHRTFLLTALLLTTARSATAGPPRAIPVRALPEAVLADERDRLFLIYPKHAVRLAARPDGEFTFAEVIPDGFTLTKAKIAVNRDGVVGAALRTGRTVCSGRGKNVRCRTTTRVIAAACAEPGQCAVTGQASYHDGPDAATTVTDVAIDPAGTVGFGVARLLCSGSGKKRRCHTKRRSVCGGATCDKAQLKRMQQANAATPPIAEARCNSGGLFRGPGRFVGSGISTRVPGPAMYARTCLVDRAGRPHLIYHDPSERAVKHAWLDGQRRLKVDQLDGPETGTYNAAAALPGGRLLVFAYAFRNAFNKGVTAYLIDDKGTTRERMMVTRSRDGNPGWHLVAGASSAGRIVVGYHRDARSKEPVLTLYDSVEAMRAAAPPEPRGWERSYQDYFFLAGAGGFYPLWLFVSGTPDDEDGVPLASRFSPRYDVESTFVNSFKFEGRWGSFNFTVAYLRGLINNAIEDAAGEVAATAFDRLAGSVGWDKLLFYHDVRLSGVFSRIRGRYEDANGHDAPQIFDSDYTRVTLTLLNAFRLRYGLFYQTYEFYMPLYVYRARAGSASYSFVESFSSDLRFHDVGLTVGYSRLDYASKYENAVFDWFVDFDLGFGLSHASFPSRQVAGKDLGGATTFMVPFNVEAGLLAYKRFYSLRGFGGYARVGYKAEGNYTGHSGKPDDRESDETDDESIDARYSRFELRHGPYVDVGLVF